MELEGIGGVSMGDGGFEIRREIDDRDGLERASEIPRFRCEKHTRVFVESHALFDADAAPDAKKLGDERDLVCGLHLDTEFAHFYDRT